MPPKDPAAYMRQYRAARRQPIEARPCGHCQRSFTPQRSDARYCGDACRSAARRHRIDVKWKLVAGWQRRAIVCAHPGCAATARFCERRHHVGTGQTDVAYWCDEHADRPPVRRATVNQALANAAQFKRAR